jgi:putative methyltransferase (TIGR04325 family)
MNFNVIKYKINKRLIRLFGDKTYNSYSDALKNCVSNGYENNVIIDLAKEKTRLYRQNIENGVVPHAENLSIFPLLSLINELARQNKPINVIDFGGADGGHYLIIRQLLANTIRLNWQVVETSEMVKGMQAFATNELSFCDNLDKAIQEMGAIDILFTSGTLQYTPNPYDFIDKMLNSNADYLIFNRQSLNVGDRDLITIQRSLLSWHGSKEIKNATFVDQEISYPHTNISVQKFEALLNAHYKVVYTYADASGVKKVRNETIVGKSYVLKKVA